MTLRKEKNTILAFKISWLLLFLFIMCDFTIAQELIVFGQKINVQLSNFGILTYITIFLIFVPFQNIMKNISNIDSLIIKLMLALLVVAYISSSLGLYPGPSLITTFFRYNLLFICFVITIVYCSLYPSLRDYIIYSFIFFNIFLVISCLLDFYVPGFNALLIEHFGHTKLDESFLILNNVKYLRPSGFVTETNLSALSIVLSNIILLINIDKFRNKWPFYLFILASGFVFGMQGSRSAFLLLIFILILIFIFKIVNRRRIVYFFLLFIIIQVFTPQTQARLFSSAQKKDFVENDIELGRVLIWKSAFEAFKSSPIIGIGTDVFYRKSLEYLNMFKTEERERYDAEILLITGKGGVNPHSLFLHVLTEYGILGFIILLLIIFFVFKNIYANKKYFSLLVFIGLLFVSSISSYAPYYKYYMLLCTIFYVNINNDLRIGKDAV